MSRMLSPRGLPARILTAYTVPDLGQDEGSRPGFDYTDSQAYMLRKFRNS